MPPAGKSWHRNGKDKIALGRWQRTCSVRQSLFHEAVDFAWGRVVRRRIRPAQTRAEHRYWRTASRVPQNRRSRRTATSRTPAPVPGSGGQRSAGSFRDAREALELARQHAGPGGTSRSPADGRTRGLPVASLPTPTPTDALRRGRLGARLRLGNESGRAAICLLVRGMVKWNLSDLPAAMAVFSKRERSPIKLDSDELRIAAEGGLGLVHSTRGENPPNRSSISRSSRDWRSAERSPAAIGAELSRQRSTLSAKDYPQGAGIFRAGAQAGERREKPAPRRLPDSQSR